MKQINNYTSQNGEVDGNLENFSENERKRCTRSQFKKEEILSGNQVNLSQEIQAKKNCDKIKKKFKLKDKTDQNMANEPILTKSKPTKRINESNASFEDCLENFDFGLNNKNHSLEELRASMISMQESMYLINISFEDILKKQ